MTDYEKLGVFYLGRHHDPDTRQTGADLLLLESKSLVTHGLVVGMTGSGKTGLCFDLIEEAAIDGIPAIVIDPKGDLGNLLLTFPELRPEDFAPWINPDDAQKQGVSVGEFAAKQAALWQKGLANWQQDGERIRRLKSSAEFAIYTPGSSAGRSVSILRSFSVPPDEVLEDGELLRDRVTSTVAGLLGLAGVTSDPTKGRESILLAHLLQNAWARRRELDLAGLIQEVQNPSVQRIGVLDLETFFPAKDRFELALQLNNLLASPSMTAWTAGEPLDVAGLLHTPAGKPRVSVISIAHLGDAERMFFVTLLLNEVVAWMRTQSGTSSLRALVYMDEIFGYFPPVANPPSKQPLLTLLKQARAFGVGVALATQNPVDLDYRGLANIGTWFIGRLQTDRDKARVLEGLEGAAAGRGQAFDRAGAERLLAGLGSRIFLLHSVHQDGFEVFESRWALSYLRGPLSRNQIKSLMDPMRAEAATQAPAAQRSPTAPAEQVSGAPAVPPTAPAVVPASCSRPVLPPGVPQFFLPTPGTATPTARFVPRLVGVAQVRFVDAKAGVDEPQTIIVATEITDNAVPVDWSASEDLEMAVDDLSREPVEGTYATPAAAAGQARNYAGWTRDFAAWLAANRRLSLWRDPSLGQVSRPGEAECEFSIRLQQAAREARDAAAEKLKAKYAPKLAALQERLRRAEAAKEREASQATRAKLDTLISVGSTLLGAFLGRKAFTSSTVGRAATSMRSAGRAMDQAGDVARAGETVEAVRAQLQALEDQFQAEVNAASGGADPATAPLEKLDLRLTRPNIQVKLVALVWLAE